MTNVDVSLPVPVIIVEDEPLIQTRLREILIDIGYHADDLYFAQNLAQANELLKKYSASFALVDLGLPDGNGVEFIKTIKAYDPTITTLVISAWSTEEAIFNALLAGATGYVLKERDDIEVSLSIRSVLRGGAPIDPFIAIKILNQLKIQEQNTFSININDVKQHDEYESLSKREHEILTFVARGLSNREIAEQLFISRYTVESHIKHIYRKLEVCTRLKAVDTARTLGLL